jgi:hypothetical protein
MTDEQECWLLPSGVSNTSPAEGRIDLPRIFTPIREFELKSCVHRADQTLNLRVVPESGDDGVRVARHSRAWGRRKAA